MFIIVELTRASGARVHILWRLRLRQLTEPLQGFGGAYVCPDMNKLLKLVTLAVIAPLAAAFVAAMTMAVVLG